MKRAAFYVAFWCYLVLAVLSSFILTGYAIVLIASGVLALLGTIGLAIYLTIDRREQGPTEWRLIGGNMRRVPKRDKRD